jgi:DNA repair protein SbcC/Rad50
MQAADNRARQIEDELARARVSMVDFDRRIEAAARMAPDLATALAGILPHIHGEDCPVCGRNYSEVSAQPLTVNLRTRLQEMSDAADQLAGDVAERSRLAGRVAELDRERDTLASTIPSAQIRQKQKAEQSAFVSLLAEARDTISEAALGAQIMRVHSEVVRAIEGWTRADAEEQVLTADVATLEKELGLFSDSSGVQERIDACRDAIEVRRRQAQTVASALGTAREMQARVDALTANQERARVRHLAKAEAKVRADTALRAARGVRDAIGRVGDAAARARANAVSQVFNDRLNSLWRDLFVRLAPDERFVPSFDVPDYPGDRVRPSLKTIHRSGEEGGAPSVMLSSGNLNTAALTLFLALHLAVRPKLPWLVLDEPVQSMDDVHIANFAALLRTLSKQHGRQILVAVQNRNLFDYLTLEMSPAFPGDELITIELERSAVGHIWTKDNRLGYVERPKIVAAA